MHSLRRRLVILAVGLMALAGCGGSEDADSAVEAKTGGTSTSAPAGATATSASSTASVGYFIPVQVPDGFTLASRHGMAKNGPANAENHIADDRPVRVAQFTRGGDGGDVIVITAFPGAKAETTGANPSLAADVQDVRLRGHRGVTYRDAGDPDWLSVVWMERSDVALQVHGRGVTREELLAAARSLREEPAEEDARRQVR